MSSEESAGSATQELENELELETMIDAKPKKRIIENKARKCMFENAIGEIIDNCIDYWIDIEKPHPLNIAINIQNAGSEEVTTLVSWNMGVPKDRWRPLLTPGSALHQSIEGIGVWGEGFKIAIFSTGKEIDVFTKNLGVANQISIPRNFLETEDWRIPVYKGFEKGVEIDDNSTLVRLKGKAFNDPPVDIEESKIFIAETFGTRLIEESQLGYEISITMNGEPIEPVSYTSGEALRDNFSYPPGFEPSNHIIYIEGMKVRLFIGLLRQMDAVNYGVYMYGNGRMFAKRMRNEVVGFGTRANSPIPADHPTSKRIQIHVFFEGSPNNIPWQAPLKDQVIERHPVVNKVADLIKLYAKPYAQFMIAAQNPELTVFSQRWNDLDEAGKKMAILTNDEKKKLRTMPPEEQQAELEQKWESLPEKIKAPFVLPPIETWDHGEFNKGRKPSDTPKFGTKMDEQIRTVLKERHDGKISTFEFLPRLVDIVSGTSPTVERAPAPSRANGPSVRSDDDPKLEGAFLTTESSITLSIRMDPNEANDLSFITGERSKTDVLRKVIDGYKSIQGLKRHPYFQNKKKVWKDQELVEEITKLLANESQ